MKYLILSIFALIFISPALAASSPQCDERGKIIEYMEKKYKETTIAAGVTSGGGLVEVLSTADGGTWTIIITSPQGMSCLMSAGEGWRVQKSKLQPTDSGA